LETFTIFSPSGATLQGTVVKPEKVAIEVKSFSTGNKIQIRGINNFFVVMTVQKDNPPKVKILDRDLNTKVIIGEQTISYRDDRIIFDR
jgi:hypothetical protein